MIIGSNIKLSNYPSMFQNMCTPHIRIPQTTKGVNVVPRFINGNVNRTIKRVNIVPKINTLANKRKIYCPVPKKIYSDHPFIKKSSDFESNDIDEDYHSVTNFISLPTINNFVYMNNVSLATVSEDGDLALVKKYIKSGANIHFNDNYALRWACRNGHFDVVEYLVENGADIYANNNEPLQWASINNHLEIVEYLVEKDRKNV